MRKTRTFKIAANVCRLILACTFIVSGFTKVIDPWGTAKIEISRIRTLNSSMQPIISSAPHSQIEKTIAPGCR